MPVRPVVRIPERVLKQRAAEIGGTSDDALVADLVDTMRASPACVGLAAPQIGVSRRAFALDVSGHPKTDTCHGLVVLLDPVILEQRGREVGREGCMSVPDLTANVGRATSIVVSGTSPDGERTVIATDGFEARAFQHEIDHLDGMLILDRVASLTTDVFRRRVYK
ncbi:MAG TPA: peptide deformylase [Actinomycetota bacterium]|nr:peptide deformylase [Actinomycetota bacterium]